MTREILLERELWERKNELLGFLVNFCATTTERLDLDHILRSAYSGLCRLLPLHSMHLALWEQEDADTAPSVSLYIHASKNSGEYGFWRDTLLDQAGRLLGPRFSLKETRELELDARHVAGSPPQNSSPLVLPVVIGQQRLGSLVLLTGMERHLGRDQALALDSAMRHFALNIKNARRFQRIQMYADYDVLTGVHNRRHCERRIEEELNHVSRYAQPLSLLMLDIDHFKRINDACGHHAGDAVLRQVASLLTRSIRATDYCARYGGEEFIILMPHTGSKKALHLAERIRKIIAAHSFAEDGDEPLRLTVSLGLACMEPDACKSGRQLLKEADAALYAAKADGRNCTRKNAA
jgi:diguanylate cyclase (GGDEF)-like protein